MALRLMINLASNDQENAKADQLPWFLNCQRIDGFLSISDAADGVFDTVEVSLEGKLQREYPHRNQRHSLKCYCQGSAKTWISRESAAVAVSCVSTANQRASFPVIDVESV